MRPQLSGGKGKTYRSGIRACTSCRIDGAWAEGGAEVDARKWVWGGVYPNR